MEITLSCARVRTHAFSFVRSFACLLACCLLLACVICQHVFITQSITDKQPSQTNTIQLSRTRSNSNTTNQASKQATPNFVVVVVVVVVVAFGTATTTTASN